MANPPTLSFKKDCIGYGIIVCFPDGPLEHTSGGEKIMTAGNVKGFRDGEKVLDGFTLGSLGDGQ